MSGQQSMAPEEYCRHCGCGFYVLVDTAPARQYCRRCDEPWEPEGPIEEGES